MSLLRLAFWLALLVLLLPTDAAQQARFTSFASTALARVSTFCDRNGRACDAGAAVWATFLRKAEFGIRLVGDLLGAGGRQIAEQGPDLPPGHEKHPDRRLGKADPRGTLSPSDIYDPPWRAPKRPKEY
jgi:hypothetical protein